MIDIALRQLLLVDNTVSAAFGGEIYVLFRDTDDGSDFITITDVNQQQPVNVQRETGQNASQIQIDIFSGDGIKLRQITTYLLKKLNGHAHKIGDIDIQVGLYQGKRNSFDSADRQHRCSMDFKFYYD